MCIEYGIRHLTFFAIPEKQFSLKFASYYNDHMVLQQAPKRYTIWGYAGIDHFGSEVKVVLSKTSDTVLQTKTSTVRKGTLSFSMCYINHKDGYGIIRMRMIMILVGVIIRQAETVELIY